ncbi:hypothetical protein [Nocardiopsis suaedae]|uniref:Uncharacterized protein n=1 Tax=Nocardiopsis suaedae TaxID=3018444 RepID=A0ABT4TL99_9ACTN|nr:hypothetical protein [Nocardiopsis suaedae]MDA2805462.1 hypothetical protein [Nocardiopsis suaedae]
MALLSEGDRPRQVGEALKLLHAQGVIDGVEIGPAGPRPYAVKLVSGIVHMSEDEAAMFALGAAVGAFGGAAKRAL